MKSYIKAFVAIAALMVSFAGFSQAKKPTLMVMPAEIWCTQNGYMTTYDNQGKTTRIPDYEKALQENADLYNVIAKLNELMAERGFPMKDLSATVRNLSQTAAENEMTVSRTSGAVISESPLDVLLNRAKADIIIEVAWQIATTGPKKTVTYSLKGLDAYTGKQIAGAQGTGAPSFSADVPVLLEEASLQRMDQFVAQLQDHFDDLLANGREVIINLNIFDNGSGLSFEDEYADEELTDVIENWIAENTVEHRYSLMDATDNMLHFEQVRIPLYRENGRPMDTRQFAADLRKYLGKAPFNIPVKVVGKGLGRADLYLGEK